MSSGECVALAAAGGLAGAGIGALIGSRIRVSALQVLPAVSAAGTPQRAAIAVRIDGRLP